MIGEEETAVGADHAIHEREINRMATGIPRIWLRFGQHLHGRLPTGSFALKKEGKQPARRGVFVIGLILPAVIANQKSIAVLLWQLSVFIQRAPGRRTSTHVQDSWQRV